MELKLQLRDQGVGSSFNQLFIVLQVFRNNQLRFLHSLQYPPINRQGVIMICAFKFECPIDSTLADLCYVARIEVPCNDHKLFVL